MKTRWERQGNYVRGTVDGAPAGLHTVWYAPEGEERVAVTGSDVAWLWSQVAQAALCQVASEQCWGLERATGQVLGARDAAQRLHAMMWAGLLLLGIVGAQGLLRVGQ